MKKKNLKSLKLRKEKITSLESVEVKGGCSWLFWTCCTHPKICNYGPVIIDAPYSKACQSENNQYSCDCTVA